MSNAQRRKFLTVLFTVGEILTEKGRLHRNLSNLCWDLSWLFFKFTQSKQECKIKLKTKSAVWLLGLLIYLTGCGDQNQGGKLMLVGKNGEYWWSGGEGVTVTGQPRSVCINKTMGFQNGTHLPIPRFLMSPCCCFVSSLLPWQELHL